MLGISATEAADDTLLWLLPATERPADGEAAAVHVTTVLDWCRRPDSVAGLTVLAPERPETPATEVFSQQDLLQTMLEVHGHRDVVRMPAGQAPDFRAAVIDLRRLVGSHPSSRQPPPGTRKVRAWRS